ncbi:uncharacterized protein LOC132544725 [Ylistrum balloti]|uniref:uncharacterized protein LOC132544725 n=1 Tax=Ylistrum balloti TaxID=509963 RepID=UPI002905A665|nr:uncharacterized protein LOC132544725 [Ylistrum balloti]
MARTKNQDGTCSTPVKGQVNHSHLYKNQGLQQCDVEEQLNSSTPIKKGNVSSSSSKFGKRSRSSSPRQHDLSSRRSPRSGVSQELLCQTEVLVPSVHQVTDHLSQKTTTPSTKPKWKRKSPGDTVQSVPKNSLNQEDLSDSPKTASLSLNIDSKSDRKSENGAAPQDVGRIFVYQNVKHAISGLPGDTGISGGTSTPIVCIRDVLQGDEEAKLVGSGTLRGSELKKHLLKSFITPEMANEEPNIVGSKKKVSPKQGPVHSQVKNENRESVKCFTEKPLKTKVFTKSLLKDVEKKEQKKSIMLLKECPPQSPSNGAKSSPTPDQVEKVKTKKKKRSPSSTISTDTNNLSDTSATETRLQGDLGSIEITLNNGDQLQIETGSDEMSGSQSTSPTPPRDGDLRQGRRIRSPSVRYADDMILFPLKSPRKSPKLGNARDGNSPEDRQDKTPEGEKPFRLEGEKVTKTAECQTSELYALLTKTLSNDKIITPSRRKSPDTAMVNDKSPRVKKVTGAVREIDFSEGVKNNTRDSQIQVQMEEHLANVRKEELMRLRNEFNMDTDDISSQSTSAVASFKRDKCNFKSDSMQSPDITSISKQKITNKNISKQSDSKVGDSKPKKSVKKESKQKVPKQADFKQKTVLKSDEKQITCNSKTTDSQQCVTKQSDSKPEYKETDLEHRKKSTNKSVPKASVSKQSECRLLDSKQCDSKPYDNENSSRSVSTDSNGECYVKMEPKKTCDKIDSKHKSKTKNSSKHLQDNSNNFKQSDCVRDNWKHQKDINGNSERTGDSSNLKQNLSSESDTKKLRCDNVKVDSKESCTTAVKMDLKRPSGVKCESQQNAKTKRSPDKKDFSIKVKKDPDQDKGDLCEASDVKQESITPTDNIKSDESQNTVTDASELCNEKEVVGKSDSLSSQRSKCSNLFSLISRVKSNLECSNPLPEFLNSPFYESAQPGDEEEDASDESFTALDKDDIKLKDKDSSSISEKLSTKIPDNEAGSTSAKDNCTEKMPQLRKNDQDKNSLEDLLNSGRQEEESQTQERVTRRSQNKNQSPGRVTRAQTSPEKTPIRSSRRYNSPDKSTIYPADVILVNSATSSSDNVKPESARGQKLEEKMEDTQSGMVTSTDADSTTDDSPARKNIFDLLMGSYTPDEKEGDDEEGNDEEETEVLKKQDNSDSVTEKSVSTGYVDGGKIGSKNDSDESQTDLQAADSSKKESAVSLQEPVNTVDLTCDEDCLDSISDDIQGDQSRLKSSQSGLASAFRGNQIGSSTTSIIQRGQTGYTGHDTPERPKITEPRPLDVLKSVEMDTPDKMSAFQSKSLDDYLQKMKKQDTPVDQEEEEEEGEDNDDGEEQGEEEEDEGEVEEEDDEGDEDAEQREFEEELEPDFDEVDGMVFVSFPSEETLNAHIEVERNTRIGKNENLLLGISRLKNLRQKREHIQSKYKKKIHRLKALKAQGQMNQNLRGMHKALEKYQKLYRTELYMILKSKNKDINFKSPQKTSDITKIKGWKKKFGNTEQLAEATGLPISQAGKLHWRTEARLLKNLKPDELKEIGLNLKKKRRKNLIFTIRKGMSKGDNRPDRNEDGAEEYEDADGDGYDREDNSERNEDEFRDDVDRDDSLFDDFNISPEKEKKSQYMKKQERLKKRLMLQSLSFGPEEETIIRKLGGQRSLRKSILGLTSEDRAPVLEEVTKGKRGRKRKGEAMTLTTVSQNMAIQALAALDSRFVKEKPKPAAVSKAVIPVKDEPLDRLGLQEDGDKDDEWLPPQEGTKDKRIRGRKKKKKLAHKIKEENEVQCDQPGCRYGCICHLCKFAESAPDHESGPSLDTPCDKEYCRLGCICDSIGARGHDPMEECQKPECQNDCSCIKEEDSVEGTEEEKRQRQKAAQKRFEALPRRQSTYRLAKNLDAVSRKAMLYYESSEMYCTEQSTRKRKSKESDDLPIGQQKIACHTTTLVSTPTSTPNVSGILVPAAPAQPSIHVVPPPTSALESKMNRYVITAGQIKSSSDNKPPEDSRNLKSNENLKSASKPSKQTGKKDPPWYPSSKSRKKEEGNVRRTEFDDITFDEMLESDNEDSVEFNSCARTIVYNSTRRNKQRCTCHTDNCSQATGSCQGVKATHSGEQKSNKTVEVGDSLSPIVISPGNTPPCSPSNQNLNKLSDRIGYTGSKNVPAINARKAIHTGWHTQWVCLKTSKKKPEEEEESYEIRLLEMISNCNWENAKQKILSKISNQISREQYPNPRQMIVGDFCISFLPRSDKPAVIPPEVKAKLPKSIFSIRIKVEKRSHALKTRLGEFINAQEKILKPSLESQDVIALDSPPTVTTTTTSSTCSSTGLLTGGISGLSHLQIKGHTTSTTRKWIPVSSTEGKTVTSPSHVSPQGVSSLSTIFKPGMCTKVGASPSSTVIKSQSNNLVILQNTGGQKYVLASPITQPNLQLVSPANSSSPIISSSVSQSLLRGTSASLAVSTSATVVSSNVPVTTSTLSGIHPTSFSSTGVPVVISTITSTTSACARTPTLTTPIASIGMPIMNSNQICAKIGVVPSVNPNTPRAVSPANSGIALFASNVPQSNSSKIGSTPVSCPNVINMTFTLPGKSSSHSTLSTHSVPVNLLANSQAVTMVTVATSVSPASSVKAVPSPMSGSLLTQLPVQGMHPSVKLASAGPGVVSKLVPIVPKPKLKKILIPIQTPPISSFIPVTTSNQPRETTAQKIQKLVKANKESSTKEESPMVLVKEMRLGPSDNKTLVETNTKEKGDAMFHSFILSRPHASTEEGEETQDKKRKKQVKDGDNQEIEGDTEDKKKKKRKKKKPKSSEGDDGETKSQEEGKKVSKKRKKKKQTNKIDNLIQNDNSESVAYRADSSSPPTKKCRNDSMELAEEESLTCDSVKEKIVCDTKCDGSEDMETNTRSGSESNVMTNSKCDVRLDTKCDKVVSSDLEDEKTSPRESKCIKDLVTSTDISEINYSKNDMDSSCGQNKMARPDLHSILFSQIENSIREYDLPNTSEYMPSTGESEKLTLGKPEIRTCEVTGSRQCIASTADLDTPQATENKDGAPNTTNILTEGVIENNSNSLPTASTSDGVDKKSNVLSKNDLTGPQVCGMPSIDDQMIVLDSPSQFEMDAESSEGDRQSCETSQNSLNDLKMLATVQKASVDILQIIEGSKNPEGAKHPLVPASGEDDLLDKNIHATQNKVTIPENEIENGVVGKLVGKSMDIVNSIRHHVNMSQDKIRETKVKAGSEQEVKIPEELEEEEGTWDLGMSHEGCDDVIISLSDDESNSQEDGNPVDDGTVSVSKEGSDKQSEVHTQADPVSVIVIDDEDKPSDDLQNQQSTASNKAKSDRVTSHARNDDIKEISLFQNDDSDIDIENASDEETGSNQLQFLLRQESQTAQQLPACSIHSHKGKRKASLDTIDNMLKHSVEFREGIVKSSKNSYTSKEKISRHSSMEKQRRRELKNGFKDLIEVIFGQDDAGHKKPLSVEAIQGASKIKVLHMALNMIKENEERSAQCVRTIDTLRIQNKTLQFHLNRSRSELINSGMAAVKIQDILNKISKTCQFIFAKREMLMKKRLETQKSALETFTTPEVKAEVSSEPKSIIKSKKTKSSSKTKPVQSQNLKAAQRKAQVVTPILPKSVTYTAVPVQLVSTAQVIQMAQINQQANPEIYIDNAEDRGTQIKEERLSEDEYAQDMPLQVGNGWSLQEDRAGVNSALNENRQRVSSNTTSNHGNDKMEEEELDRMNTQSPVFSDVDISENYFVQEEQDDEDDNMDVGGDGHLTSSHTSSDMEYKVIDTSSHSEVMVGYIPEDRGEQDRVKPLDYTDKSDKDSSTPAQGVS